MDEKKIKENVQKRYGSIATTPRGQVNTQSTENIKKVEAKPKASEIRRQKIS